MSEDPRIMATFQLDAKNGMHEVQIETPFNSRSQARDQLNERLKETANGSTAMMPVRDVANGNYQFINTMKLAGIEIWSIVDGEEL